MKKKNPLRFVFGLVVLVGAFYMLVGSMFSGGTYFFTVDEAVAKSGSLTDRAIRVKGIVHTGTYEVSPNQTEHRFKIEENGQLMAVYYKGPMPDVFTEGVEVVAEGRLGDDGTLVATEIVAKCPSKYEDGKVPEEMKKKLGVQAKGSS